MLLPSMLLLFLVCTLSPAFATLSTNTFYLTGLFPLDSRDARTQLDLGIYTKAAAEMAVRDINRVQLLGSHNFTMKLIPLNSGCQKATSANALVEMVEFLKETNEFEGERNLNSQKELSI